MSEKPTLIEEPSKKAKRKDMHMEVLLVEDSPGDVRLTQEAFRSANMSIHLHVVTDGMEAVDFLRRRGAHQRVPRPDIILLDLNLPKMDGREVLAYIKEDENLKRIPTVILTTSEAEADIVKSYQLQANGYLRKPVQLDAFESLVKGQVAAAEVRRMTKNSIRRLLLIEDNPGDARLIREMFNEQGLLSTELTHVESMSEGVQHLAEHEVDIMLIDLGLPDAEGLGAVRRAHAAAPHVPIVVLTGLDDESMAVQALQEGAQDFLIKGQIETPGFLRALRYAIERKLMEEALSVKKERAEVTLNSIGDAIICTDTSGNITFLNLVAEHTTGWSWQEATGRPMDRVFRILDAATRQPVSSPMDSAVEQDRTVHLRSNCLLIRRDGMEIPIEDSVAPIHDREGEVTGAVIVFRDVSADRVRALQLAHSAQHDFLTGLPNRMLLNDRISQAIATAPRHLKQVAVLFLDLDGFKQINDSLGHPVGDKLLQSVAKRLLGCVRTSDTVSRQGGDEFVVLLSEAEQWEDAAIIARRMLQSVAETHSIDQHELHVTTSIGLSVFPDDGLDAGTLIQNADTAMYQAKKNGRQSYQFFRPAMNVRAVERQSIEESLRLALERKEFVLNYQPKINLTTGAITGAEALVRWMHPTRGLLLPAQFISIAEDCGLIVAIGKWVLREACEQVRAWVEEELPVPTMAVNVSAMELQDEKFIEGLFAILSETGLEPKSLELELTESALMNHVQSTASLLQTLRQKGLHVAVDDFGTGYSSLSYLRKFPIDALKIDQSFVRQITTPGGDATIVTAVISMARSLNLRVVAEGVETVEELAFLQTHKCDEAQGYYFSRALPSHEFATLLRTGIPERSFVIQEEHSSSKDVDENVELSTPLASGKTLAGPPDEFVEDLERTDRQQPKGKQGQDQFQELMAHLQQVFWIKDNHDSVVLYVSPAYEKIWGRTCQSLRENSHTFMEAVHPQDRDRMASAMAGKHGTGKYDEEFRILRPDGKMRWIRARGYPVRDDQGQIMRFAGIAEDITEKKGDEKERSRLAAIIEYSDDVVVSITVDGIIIGWNSGAERQYGYTYEEMMGRSLSILFPTGQYQEYLAIIKKVKNGEAMPAYDAVRRRKDGTLTNVSIGIAPIETREGEVVGASKIGHDIARIKTLEAQFIEAQKMEVVGKLASGVAHDFNNILAVIMSYAEVTMLSIGQDDPMRKYIEEIRHAAERAGGLTRQLLVFSRKQTVQPVVLDLNEVVSGMNTMLRRLIGENIKLMVMPGKQIGRVKADSGYIGQVLMNLVVNARDAMPAGGTISIATSDFTLNENQKSEHPGMLPGDYVMFSVSDSGSGMTDEVKMHLFEAFFTTKQTGTGLGLATCKTIVQQSGAFIGFTSEVGKGTTFKVYFPHVAELLDVPVQPLQMGKLPGGTETLLVVEDERSVRDVACTVLASLGYTVLPAVNGQDGLRVAHEHKGTAIGLVFTDVIMPEMGGKVTAEWLRASYPDIKVLYTSGYTDDAIGHDGVLESGVGFLPKPYTLTALAWKVRELLDAPQSMEVACQIDKTQPALR